MERVDEASIARSLDFEQSSLGIKYKEVFGLNRTGEHPGLLENVASLIADVGSYRAFFYMYR
jgi:hypothetical protein